MGVSALAAASSSSFVPTVVASSSSFVPTVVASSFVPTVVASFVALAVAALFAPLAAASSAVAPSVEAVCSVVNTFGPIQTVYALHEQLATICASLGHNHFDWL